jgi:hypothetical protein
MAPNGKPPRSDGERAWRNTLFVLSASMAGFALVDIDAGRLASALGDAGVSLLMVSLMPQFPFVRAIVGDRNRRPSREELLRDIERVREQSPWAERAGTAGWVLLGASLVLRAIGIS